MRKKVNLFMEGLLFVIVCAIIGFAFIEVVSIVHQAFKDIGIVEQQDKMKLLDSDGHY
jgi:hypothetical protein